MKMDTAESRATWDKHAELCDQAAAILDKYAPEKKGMLDSLKGKELLTMENAQRLYDKENESMEWMAQNGLELQGITIMRYPTLPGPGLRLCIIPLIGDMCRMWVLAPGRTVI